MSGSAPSPATVLGMVDDLAPKGEPLTTAEVTAAFDCTSRTIYNKLDALVEAGALETKKVGARGRVWWRPPSGTGSNESARVAGLDAAERTGARQQLAEERDVFAEGPAVVFRWNPNADEGWPVEYVSENVEELLGYTPEEFTSGEMTYTDLLCDEEIDRIVGEVADNSDEPTERFSHEPYRVTTSEGGVRWVRDTTKIVRDETGTITHYVGYLVDITELKGTKDALERLNAASRGLMDADTEGITARATAIARDVLGVEYAALWRYDETSGELREHASHTDANAIGLPEDLSERVWQAFIGDEIDLVEGLPALEGNRREALRSLALVPLGGHGVVCAGSVHTGEIDETTADLAGTLGATLETALDRAEGERRLLRQNEELARLDRLNRLLREIDAALVRADGLEAIDRAVCERLADSDHYEFAWIGERDPVSETINPREWAGVDSGYVDELKIPIDDEPTRLNPIATAVRTQETRVVADIATETRFSPSRAATLDRGARSCISVPLVYEGALYGVLTVYADHPQPDERDHAVLAELGETISHAIDATETRATLQTDRVVELTLRCREPNTPLCRLARRSGCAIEFEGVVRHSAGCDVFFTTSGVSSGEFRTVGDRFVGVTELVHLTEREEGILFRTRLSDPTLAERVMEHDAVIRTLTIESGVATAVVDLSHTTAVREFVERLGRTVPDMELLARRTRERPLKTHQTFRMACGDRLTPKQETALRTAYLSGFFESPRTQTGTEVAASLGVSQPTFTTRLRGAQRAVCELLFDE